MYDQFLQILVETQDVTNLRRPIGQVLAPAKDMAPEGGSTRVGQGLGCGRCVCGRSRASALKPHSVFLTSGQPTLGADAQGSRMTVNRPGSRANPPTTAGPGHGNGCLTVNR